jgi:D-alanine-D-alanine ligase
MKKKSRVGVLFGGRSGEHEVSLRSAVSILEAIDRKKYDVVPIGISKEGRWVTGGEAQRLLDGGRAQSLAAQSTVSLQQIEFAAAAAVLRSGESLRIPPPAPILPDTMELGAGAELAYPGSPLAGALDVVFPVLHGTFGEDGTIQGLFELADVAYVGSGVLGSAVGMDKDTMKRLFASAGLPQTPYLTVLRNEWRTEPKRCMKQIERALEYPLFVKPANLGSSVGISKVHDRSELGPALDLAAAYDRKLVIEQGVGGPEVKPRELEVAVLGNNELEVSVVGEIVPNKEFYDYDSKYSDSAENPSVPIIPATLSKAEEKEIRALAAAAYRACDCAGLARVDFLMEPVVKNSRRTGGAKASPTKGMRSAKPRIFLNEINTMPGFTSISMYPKLWKASGLSYKKLIDRLIQLALARRKEKHETRFTKE